MGKKAALRRSILGALCLPIPSVMAQDAGGIQVVVGVEQGIELGSNIGLEIPDEGNSISAPTRLTFGLSSETRVQQLNFEAGGTYRFENLDGENDSELDATNMALGYTRNGANASLSVFADYTVEQIDTLRTFDDFVDGGEVELPSDFTDLSGDGLRTSYSAEATLILGNEDAPLGFQFDLGTSGTTYDDATDADLTNEERAFVAAAARAQLSPVLTGTLGAGYTYVDEDDATETKRDIQNVDVGVSYLISPRTTIDAGLGYVWNRTEETTGVTNFDGPTGLLGVNYDLPNGSVGAILDSRRAEDGTRIQSVRVLRDMELPAGPLSASIGLARGGSEDPAVVGSLNWVKLLPSGSFTARLDRSMIVDSDDDLRVTTLGGLDYRYDINEISSLIFDLSYAVSEASDAADRVDEGSFTATYSRALTAEWDFNAAVGYRMRDESGTGQANSFLISATIGRSFSTWR
ncbi:hypothetical protein [Roseovarius sp. M141]|uniref:hypothetical protein n=1 Tax=Roseovarius sp. M141 TaxID=2583806 RepID=UPI0020CCBF49|nr:hypothetical protein [Roseovarius sp. M141]MCQ0090460.1 hypothetical protein [Roseovarius sp. M141]